MLLGSMPQVDPKAYADITGQACTHVFKKTGFCRYRNGGVGCGSFGEGMAFRPRLEILEVIFRTYGRIPDGELGKASLAALDRIFPPDATVQEAGKLSYDFEGTAKNLNTMSLLLSVVETAEEWRSGVDYFEKGFQGEVPLISDPMFLESRAHSTDPLVRRGFAAIVSHSASPPSPEHVATMLADPDEVLSKAAGDQVFQKKEFSQFGNLFRRRPPDVDRIEAMSEYTDADLATLLALDDPVVDDVCFSAIAKGQRLPLLDPVVERLNHRGSNAGRKCVAQLLRGPTLGYGTQKSEDPREACDKFGGSLEEAIERVRAGYSSSSYFGTLIESMKLLAGTHDPAHWPIVKRAYEQSADGDTGEFWMAIMAKAMMELDPDRTRDFLINELGTGKRQRSMSALAGMGYLALPEFKDVISGFIARKGTDPYPGSYSTHDGERGNTVAYALHRCTGIQNWRLRLDDTGKFFVERP